jgi:deoxyribose-phosphate aldolase
LVLSQQVNICFVFVVLFIYFEKFYILNKGGIKTAKDACTWLTLMKEELDDTWTTNKLFRIGASSLLGDIERQVYHYATGRYAASNELP